jgi:hypothetical protein
MNRPTPFQSLLAAAARGAAEDERAAARIAARIAWVKEIMAKLRAAQQRADEAWLRAVGALPEDHSDEELEAIPEPPEQAELDAIRAQVDAVVEQDRWPKELYWSL